MAATSAGRRTPFSNLYRQSRLVQIAQPGSTNADKKSRPVRQVIHSTPASNHRREYGLKRAMPKALNSRYITVDKLDTPYGFTEYNPGSSKALIHNRLQSLAVSSIPIPRKSRENPDLSPLLFGDTNATNMNHPQRKLRGLRSEFIEWLRTRRREKRIHRTLPALYDHPYELEQLARQFLSTRGSSHKPEREPIATAGMNYTLPGSVFNKPTGLTSTVRTPGRFIERNGSIVATSGVVAMSDMGGSHSLNNNMFGTISDRARIRQKVADFDVRRLKVSPKSAQALLTVQPVSSRNTRNSLTSPIVNRPKHSTATSSSTDEPIQHNESNALYRLINDTLFS